MVSVMGTLPKAMGNPPKHKGYMGQTGNNRLKLISLICDLDLEPASVSLIGAFYHENHSKNIKSPYEDNRN